VYVIHLAERALQRIFYEVYRDRVAFNGMRTSPT